MDIPGRNIMINISIIMPTYNRADTIARAIESVLNQSYTNWELIIVDDASNDNTEAVVNRYIDGRIKYYKNKQNEGANKTRNIGIATACGEFITFLDSDCAYKNNKLEEQINIMKDGHDMVFCAFEYYKDNVCNVVPLQEKGADYYNNNLRTILTKQNVIDTSTIMIRSDFLKEIGAFDVEMPRLQDYELAMRIVKEGNVQYIDKVLVENYFMKDSISTNHKAYFQAIVKIIKKHSDFFINEDEIVTFLCMGLNYCFGRALNSSVINSYIDLVFETLYNDMPDEVLKFNRYVLELYQLRSHLYERNREQYKLSLRDEMKSEFIIYGAGKSAYEIYNKLTFEEQQNIKYFVTSEKDTEMDSFLGKPILSLQELIATEKNEKIFILLALNIKNTIAVRKLLDLTPYQNYAFYNI